MQPWIKVVDALGHEVADAQSWSLFGGRGEARVFGDWISEAVAGNETLAGLWRAARAAQGGAVRIGAADLARLCATLRHALDAGGDVEGVEPDLLDQFGAFVDVAERLLVHLRSHPDHDAALGL